MKGNSQKTTQVKVCHVCGDKGFSNALIDCSTCPDTFAHQYCMGIPPGSVDSSFTWVCEDCCEPAEHQPSVSMMPRDFSAKSSEEAFDVSIHMNDTKRKMKAITSLYSESCTHKGMGNKHKRKRDFLNPDTEVLSTSRSRYKVNRLKDQSLSTNKDNKPAKVKAKSKSGSSPKVRGHPNNNVKIRNEEQGQPKCVTNSESSTDPDNWKLVLLEEQPEPLLTLMPIEYEGSSERAETSYGSLMTEPWDPISSVMDCPKEIMRGVVLLVSPLGEIYIECASFTNDLYPTSLATAILCLTNGYCDITSNDLVVSEYEQTSLNRSIEEMDVLDEPSRCTDEVGRCSDMQDMGQKISEVPKVEGMLMGH